MLLLASVSASRFSAGKATLKGRRVGLDKKLIPLFRRVKLDKILNTYCIVKQFRI